MKSFIFDTETLGKSPDGVILDISCLVVDLDQVETPPKFMDLVKAGKQWKLDVKDQLKLGRKTDPKVIEWWKGKSDEAKKVLVANGTEVKLNDALDEFSLYLTSNGIDQKTSLGFCRGQSFDFPLLVHSLAQKYNQDTFEYEPCRFWNQRDTRSIIAGLLLDDKRTTTPLRKGILQGFVKHNSLHDIAKDALMIIYAKRYALGLEELPLNDEVDPESL